MPFMPRRAGPSCVQPDIMLAMLFYAYGAGMRSSRRIESACRSDAAFRVTCGNVTPDHATIARFLVDHEAAIEASFFDVLRLCAAAGLVSVGTIAIDGTKIAADAALDKNRSAEWIRTEVARIVGEAVATDSAHRRQAPRSQAEGPSRGAGPSRSRARRRARPGSRSQHRTAAKPEAAAEKPRAGVRPGSGVQPVAADVADELATTGRSNL